MEQEFEFRSILLCLAQSWPIISKREKNDRSTLWAKGGGGGWPMKDSRSCLATWKQPKQGRRKQVGSHRKTNMPLFGWNVTVSLLTLALVCSISTTRDVSISWGLLLHPGLILFDPSFRWWTGLDTLLNRYTNCSPLDQLLTPTHTCTHKQMG